jgi:hypothetical protein
MGRVCARVGITHRVWWDVEVCCVRDWRVEKVCGDGVLSQWDWNRYSTLGSVALDGYCVRERGTATCGVVLRVVVRCVWLRAVKGSW